MSRLISRALGLALMASLALPASAGAQIYSWRDEKGSLVLSDHPPGTLASIAARTFPVAGATAVRSTRDVAWSSSSHVEDIISRHAAAQGVRPELVHAVIQTESAFDPGARSPKGAMGLMQLMPGTAARYGVSNPYDPEENVRGGVAYLSDLIERYEGNEELALAAYNAGPGAVDRFGQRVPPYRETRVYLSRVKRATSLAGVSRARIYKTVDVIDGREVPRYTNVRPGPGALELVAARRR